MAVQTHNTAARVGPRPVSWMTTTVPAVHGSFDESSAAELGLRAADVLDFSANGNVVGPPPGVAEALAGIDLSRYPDRGARRLRAALGARHALPEGSIVPGSGSTELIWSIARAFLAPGDPTLIVGPTYGEYAAASAVCGARVETCEAIRPASGLDADLLRRAVGETGPNVVWVCHPNNPTGTPFPVDVLDQIAESYPATLFVVDEAYLTLCESVASAIPLIARGNVVVLRSMTKDYALAGVRIGYVIAPALVVVAIRRALPPWSVSSVAQAAALAALDDSEHLARVRRAVAASRTHLIAGLEEIGYRPYPSVANFALVPVGDAVSVTRALIQRGFAVRDCTSFGLPDCIRIGVRKVPEQKRLLTALEEIRDG